MLKTLKLPQKRAFVVKRRARVRWNRLSVYFQVISTISMCGHQAHDVHTQGTRQKWRFSDFSKFCLKIRSHLRVPGVCLMCAHTWKCTPSLKARSGLSNAVSQAKIRQRLASVAQFKL